MFNTSLVVLNEELHLWELCTEVVGLPDRLKDFKDVIELFVLRNHSPIERHIAFRTSREDIDSLLIGYLNSHTVMAKKVETRKLNWVHINLEAY